MKNKYHDNAVSEIIGTMILLIIAVVVVSFVFYTVITNLESTDEIDVNIFGKIDTGLEAVVLEHQGGDFLGSKTNIIFDIAGSTHEFLLEEIVNNDVKLLSPDGTDNGLDDNKWSIGERLIYPIILGGQYIGVKVGDQPTNKLVFIGTLQEGYKGQGGIWPLDEENTSSVVFDKTGRNPDGDLINNPNRLNSSESKVNNSIEFNGWNQDVTINSNHALNIINNLTLMAWMKPGEENYVIDSIELAQKFGYTPWIIEVGGNYFAVVSESGKKQGVLTTIKISDQGILDEIGPSKIFGNASKSIELRPVIIHLMGDIYVVSYTNKTGALYLELKTYNISSDDGSISFIDGPKVLLSDRTIAIAYTDSSGDGMLRTINITLDGDLTNEEDSLLFDSASCNEPHIIHINNSIYAIAYRGPDDHGWIKTFTISTNGTINYTDENLEFDSNDCYEPCLTKINGTIYAVAYRGSGEDGIIKTISILDDGTISYTGESYTFEPAECYEPHMISFLDDTYIVVYAVSNSLGSAKGGYINTIDILYNGIIIGTNMNAYEFHDNNLLAPRIIQIDVNIFGIVANGKTEPGSPHPGFLKTILIGKNIFPPSNRGISKSGSYALYCNYTRVAGYINGVELTYNIVGVTDWMHIALTYDGAVIRLYIDGILEDSQAYVNQINSNDNDFYIGRWYHGIIDEVALYDEALSQTEINNHYSIPGYWILDD